MRLIPPMPTCVKEYKTLKILDFSEVYQTYLTKKLPYSLSKTLDYFDQVP